MVRCEGLRLLQHHTAGQKRPPDRTRKGMRKRCEVRDFAAFSCRKAGFHFAGKCSKTSAATVESARLVISVKEIRPATSDNERRARLWSDPAV